MFTFIGFLLLIYFISNQSSIYCQAVTETKKVIKFTPILDSMVIPPTTSMEAYEIMMFDTTGSDNTSSLKFHSQASIIQDLYYGLVNSLKKTKFDNPLPRKPSGNAPPGSDGPKGFGIMQYDFGKITDDLDDAYNAIYKMNDAREELKSELTALLKNVNEKLHMTLETDRDSHIIIVNDFLKTASDLYKKYQRIFRRDMLKVDEIIERIDYGRKNPMPHIKMEIQNILVEQATVLKFLNDVTKELVSIGFKFYD